MKRHEGSSDYRKLRSEMVVDGTPHGTASGAQGMLVTHNDALLFRYGNGHVDTARIEQEPAELVVDAPRVSSGLDVSWTLVHDTRRHKETRGQPRQPQAKK